MPADLVSVETLQDDAIEVVASDIPGVDVETLVDSPFDVVTFDQPVIESVEVLVMGPQGIPGDSPDTLYDPLGAADDAQAASLQKSSNLSDLTDPAAARDNLGLDSAALQPSTAFDAAGAADAETARALAAEANKADLVGGVVQTSQLPSLALTTAVPVANQAAMLALTSADVQPGDLALRADGAGTFMLMSADPSVLGNWKLLPSPTDAVVQVNGQTGVINLGASDVGAQPADSDLSDIAALAPTNDTVIQRKAGVWTARTPTQLKTDLAIAASDVSVSTSGLIVVKHSNVQQALADLDSAVTKNDIRRSVILPTGAVAESYGGRKTNGVAVGGISGQLRGSLVALAAGDVISSLTFSSGNTAAVSPTHEWACLIDVNYTVLAVSVDDTSAWAVNTMKTFNMISPFTVVDSGEYYICKCVVASTVPTFASFSLSGLAVQNLTPYVAVAQTGFTTPPAVGSVLSTLVSINSVDYGYAS